MVSMRNNSYFWPGRCMNIFISFKDCTQTLSLFMERFCSLLTPIFFFKFPNGWICASLVRTSIIISMNKIKYMFMDFDGVESIPKHAVQIL